MRVIARRTLREFWEIDPAYADSEKPLKAWFHEAEQAHWLTPADVKAQYRNASFLKENRVVFNIHGNKYRLVVHINYVAKIIFIRFVGTHEQYDQIDAETI
jgi:mRNA interferase HigB